MFNKSLVNMKISILVFGRYHSFDLANGLNKGVNKVKLITSFPNFKVKQWGVLNSRVITLPIFEYLNRSLVFFKLNHLIPETYIKKCFNFVANYYLKGSDVVIGWSSCSLPSIIKNPNSIFILERGSAHYSSQMNLLIEEYSKYNLEFKPDYNSWKQELLEYELCDYISVPSNFVKETFISNGVTESKIFLNTYGCNLAEFFPKEKKDDKFRVIFCGLGSIQKGFHVLLQAIELLAEDGLDIELLHVGGVEDNIDFFLETCTNINYNPVGVVAQSKLREYYSQSSVFVLPSIQDGFGMVITQAMACGLPIIVSENTGGPDILNLESGCGFSVIPGDVVDLKNKLFWCYNNQDECRKMGKLSLNLIKQNFSWDEYAKKYSDFLTRLK